MTQTVFEKMKTAISVLKLDFTTEEFATFADDQELSEEAIEAVQTVFSYISEKKQQTTEDHPKFCVNLHCGVE